MSKSNFETLIFELVQNNINFKKNFDLSRISCIKASGVAKLILFPKSSSEVITIIKKLSIYKFDFIPLGGMSNCIFRDGLIKTPLISCKDIKKRELINREITVGSGVMIASLERYLFKKNLSLYPGMNGIPASIGGAIYMNAGSYDDEISDNLISVKTVNNLGEIVIFNKNQLKFGWRSSYFKESKKYFITEAKFKVEKLNDIRKKRFFNSFNHRNKYQESIYPNLGSLFATKDIYKDIFNKNKYGIVIYLFLRVFKKLFSSLNLDINSFHERFSKKLLLNYLKIQDYKLFVSDKTANCLVNRKNYSANELIKFANYFKNKTNLELEIIIYSDVK